MPRRRTFKRRANNTGSIVKLSGKRRRPFAVRVTIGNDDNGNPVRKNIAYYETREQASDFLDMYNLMKRKKGNRLTLTEDQAQFIDESLFNDVKAVVESQKAMMTFAEVFAILYEEKYRFEKSGSQKRSWFNNLKPLHNKRMDDITLYDMQDVFDSFKSSRGKGTLAHMKVITVDIFKYAVTHEMIKRDNDFSSYIDISIKGEKKKAPKHVPFSIEEIKTLQADDTLESRLCLIYIYTGCRPIELLEIDTSNIYIDVMSNDNGKEMTVSYMIGGSKTDSGRDRIIPIHDYIKPFIVDLLEEHPDYLIMPPDRWASSKYRKTIFLPLVDRLEMHHTPYDTRHTFTTLANLCDMDAFSRKRILGHKANDLTDDVYTHTVINKLFEEVNRIKV